jgi:hypothetical protein
MSRASTEWQNCVNTLCYAVDREVFTREEVNQMFARMLQNMNAEEMHNMVAEFTKFVSVDDVEFELDLK